MERAYEIWRAFQDRFLALAAALILLACTLLALLEIFRRYILGVSFDWQSDAVTFFILSAVYLYFCISQRHNEHLQVTVVTELLDTFGPTARRTAEVMRLLALMISFVVLIAVAWWGIPEVEDALRYESRTESLAFPMWPFLAALWIGFLCMAVTLAFQIYRAVRRLRGLPVVEDPEEKPEGTGH